MTPLEAEIRSIIAADGPIPVSRYIALCLGHPQHGYYVTRDPFGAAGDFTTAPEISQMFGELIGAWAAAVWRQMGAPARVNFIELGPGRGTLMADALRATRAVADFRAAVAVHLIETSPVLRARQQALLATPASWHERIEDVPGRARDRGRERIRRCAAGRPVRQGSRRLAPAHDRPRRRPARPRRHARSDPRHFGETRRSARSWSGATTGRSVVLARRIAQHGGAALIIDYGHAATAFGDTLQAVRQHKFVDPLTDPGAADLTTQVDFAALARLRATRRRSAARPALPGRIFAPARYRATRRAAAGERDAAAGGRYRLRR